MEENNLERLLNPWASTPRLCNQIFLVSCVIGISTDPFFLYILIIDKDRKCLSLDQNVKYAALILRTITDLFYVFHMAIRLQNALVMAKQLRVSVLTGFPWWYLLIQVLAILPLPQVIVLSFLSQLAGSKSLTTRKILSFLILLQYVPRILRVYLTAKELERSFDSLTRLVWVKGAFFFIVYLVFGHIFGALWYFYAIFRETACWHKACLGLKGCKPNHFDCGLPNPVIYNKYLDEFCPVDPPNSALFDFGIFLEAVESGILTKRDFLQKFSRCIWWGLRNLSSFGQNLETSANIPENFFAVLISIVGLLSFLYLIGNIQTYMQLATTKSEEGRRKIKLKQPEIDSFLSTLKLSPEKKKMIMTYLQRTITEGKDFDVKHLFFLLEEHSDPAPNNSETFVACVTKLMDLKTYERNTLGPNVEMWTSKNDFELDIKQKIVRYARLRLQEVKNVDVGNILPILPSELAMTVKKLLCFPILVKMPMLRNKDDFVLKTICSYLKPVVYAEKNYIIREKEPLDFILLVTQGVVWCFGSSNGSTKRLKRGDYYGEKLLEWQVESGLDDQFPISEVNLKCHGKVEGFALMAEDMEHVFSKIWSKFSNSDSILDGLKPFAYNKMENAFVKFYGRKREREKFYKGPLQIDSISFP